MNRLSECACRLSCYSYLKHLKKFFNFFCIVEHRNGILTIRKNSVITAKWAILKNEKICMLFLIFLFGISSLHERMTLLDYSVGQRKNLFLRNVLEDSHFITVVDCYNVETFNIPDVSYHSIHSFIIFTQNKSIYIITHFCAFCNIM